MDIKNELKSYIVKSGFTMTEIVQITNRKYNRNDTVQNLSNKLARGTIKYSEVKEIAEVIGFDIEWIKSE